VLARKVGARPLSGAVRRMSAYSPRLTRATTPFLDADGIKTYTISARERSIDEAPFRAELSRLKGREGKEWRQTPAFAIFHDGQAALYLVLAWWGNDNELFVRVSVKAVDSWVVDPDQYSFCLWDMEIMWFERSAFIRQMYGGASDLDAYRGERFVPA
jgi:uncharacterized protein (DUF2461 family)